MTATQERAAKLQQQIDQLKARKSAILARTAQDQRKEQTRRKVLAGAFLLSATRDQPQQVRIDGKTLADFLTKPQDRELFGLPALPTSTESRSTNDSGEFDL